MGVSRLSRRETTVLMTKWSEVHRTGRAAACQIVGIQRFSLNVNNHVRLEVCMRCLKRGKMGNKGA
jgi:hypothetical protein